MRVPVLTGFLLSMALSGIRAAELTVVQPDLHGVITVTTSPNSNYGPIGYSNSGVPWNDIGGNLVLSPNPIPKGELVILVTMTPTVEPGTAIANTAIYRSKIYSAQGKAIGNVRLTQGRKGAFAGTLKLGARVFRFSGKFDAAGEFHRNLTKTRSPLALHLQLTNFGGQRFLAGSVGHGAASVGVMPLTPGLAQ